MSTASAKNPQKKLKSELKLMLFMSILFIGNFPFFIFPMICIIFLLNCQSIGNESFIMP